MASIIITGSGQEPNLEKLVSEFTKKGFEVNTFPDSAHYHKINGAKADLCIHFGDIREIVKILQLNPSAMHVFKQGENWKMLKAPGEKSSAEEIFNEVMFLHGRDSKVRQRTAVEYSGRIADYEERVRQSPSNPHSHYELGMAYKGADKLEDAFRQFNNALKIDANHLEAICELLEIAHKHPEYSELLDKRSSISKMFSRTRLDEKKRAISEIDKLITQNKTHSEPFVYLGEFYLETGNMQKAYEAYREAILRSGPLELEKALEAEGSDEQTTQRIAHGLKVVSSKMRRLFPKKFMIGDVVLKVYDKDEERKAKIERRVIHLFNEHKPDFRMPDRTEIYAPTKSVLIKNKDDPRIIHRIDRLPGVNAYHDLHRLQGRHRFELLKKITTAAAIFDYNMYRICTKEKDLSELIDTYLGNFASRKTEKFITAMRDILGFKFTDEDLEFLEDSMEYADKRLRQETPLWLLSLRGDHYPPNFLIDYSGDRMGSPEEFIQGCRIGIIDKEKNEQCYSIWDAITIFETPGCEVDKDDAFMLSLNYMITRLNLANVDEAEHKTIDDLLGETKGRNKFSKFNNYVNRYAIGYAPPDPTRRERMLPPIVKAKAQFLACRFLRHLELVGVNLNQEASCNALLEEIKKRITPVNRNASSAITGSKDSEIDEQATLNMHYEKVLSVKSSLHNQRVFHARRAYESLETLTKDMGSPAEEQLLVHMKNRGYFKAAESVLGSY